MKQHRFFYKYAQALVLLLVLIVVSLVISGKSFWLDQSVNIAIFSLMALSVGISYGQAGILSMATAAFTAIGAYATAILSVRYGLSPYAGLVVAIGLPMLCGYLLAHAMPVLASRSPWSLLPLAWMVCIYLRAALLEERKFLNSPLANQYRCYQRRTGRFAPRLFSQSDG